MTRRRAALACGLAGWLLAAHAQSTGPAGPAAPLSPPAPAASSPSKAGLSTLALAGQMGNKALLMIDGQPRMLAVGESTGGVRLVQLKDDTALVERGGVPVTLRSGASPSAVAGAPAAAGGREIVISAGPGGHFVTGGSINGRPVRFMVDTGATLVALGRPEAERLGIDLRQAETGLSQTAGGVVTVQLVTLGAVKVGDVELFNVRAVVVPGAMPQVLLGNSFLQRLQMRRDNDILRLELKP